MKKIVYKIVMIMTAVTLISGCDNKLSIEPANSIDAAAALKTAKDLQATLVGSYSLMGSNNLYSGGLQVDADLLASNGDDIDYFGTFQGLTQIRAKAIPINNAFVTGVWTDAYVVINSVNIILANLALDTVNHSQIEGEAKFIRASMYFELVKLFARAWNDGDPTKNLGVPLVLKPTNGLVDAEATPARNTVAEVYAQVISDLKTAEASLPYPESVAYYNATTGAASAMLSRVYLTQDDYADALTEANTVIQSGAYKLTNTYAAEFPYIGRAARIFNTTEDIFAQQVSEQNGVNNQNTFYASPDFGGRGDMEFTIDFLLTFEGDDDRLNLYSDDGSGETFYTDKFDNQFGNIKVLRLAEMYLTRAECNHRLNSSVGASPSDDINLIRARVDLPPLDVPTLAQILDERHRELAGEGVWLMDYKRINKSIATQPDSIPAFSPTLIFPIPQREVQINPNLVQNTGY